MAADVGAAVSTSALPQHHSFGDKRDCAARRRLVRKKARLHAPLVPLARMTGRPNNLLNLLVAALSESQWTLHDVTWLVTTEYDLPRYPSPHAHDPEVRLG